MYQGAFTLPRDIITGNVAVPNVAPGNVSVVNSELGEVSLTNSTAATITFTMTDGQTSPVTFLNAINVDPNSPVILQWNPPLPCAGGITWQASATGLVGAVLGRKVTGWVLTSGYATSTGS